MAAVGAGSFGDFVQEITRITLTLETSEANGFLDEGSLGCCILLAFERINTSDKSSCRLKH